MSELPTRFIALDEEGYALSGELRLTDPLLGMEVLSQLSFAENGAVVSRAGGVPTLVEAFDEPLVAVQVHRLGKLWEIQAPYDFHAIFKLENLRLDEWDRFHGLTTDGIPFVMSFAAQASFFDLIDDSDDDSITVDGKNYVLPPLYDENQDVHTNDFWTKVYHEEGKPRWDLGEPSPALKDMLPRLKMVKSRILVPGCGEGHDAAFFAHEGHLVTAMDFSPEAIRRAKEKYGHMQNLTFLEGDIFKAPGYFDNAFDVVFEQTCYCAVSPARRQELMNSYWRWLVPGGHLMGVFFTMHKPKGPPFGGSEWELRKRLQKKFRMIFWGRWKQSISGRQGKELFVYAQKL